MASKEIVNQVINETLTEWAERFIMLRQASAEARLGSASGRGRRSFDHHVRPATESQLARAVFLFNTYLRYADLKSKKWDTSAPPIEEIEAWIRDKGLGIFVRRYRAKYKSVPATNEKLVNKIAWGIAKKILQRGRLKKRRVPWYQSSANKGLGVLQGQLADNLSEESLNGLIKALQT